MRLKNALHLILTIAVLGAGARARAFVTLEGDDELIATGAASAQANDNLFLSHSNTKSDEVFDLTPGLELDYGKNSLLKGVISAGEDFQLYGSNSGLDTELASVAATGNYADDKTKFNFDGSFRQLDQATRDVHLLGTLVKRDLYHFDGLGEFSVADKTSVGVGVIYDDTEYQNPTFTNWQWVKIPVKYYYAVEPKLDVSAGFSYQDNQLGTGGVNSNEYFYNLGARGEFTPKLTGELNVGYEEISFDKGGNRGGLGVDSNLIYAYSPKTSFTLGVNNDFGYSAAGGASYRISGVNGGVTSQLSDQWQALGQIAYSRYDYISTTQKDNFYNGQIGLSYTISVHATATATYGYVEDSSNITPDSFTDNLFTLSLALRY
jgi:hypothetical protein